MRGKVIGGPHDGTIMDHPWPTAIRARPFSDPIRDEQKTLPSEGHPRYHWNFTLKEWHFVGYG